MSETQDFDGILDKHFTKGSLSHFKESYYGMDQLEVSGDEIMRASPSK
jgi:hypothetical protein